MAPHTPPPLSHGVITGPTRLPKRSLPARRRVKMVLHRGIVTGTIPGGTRLVQSSIAAELAVSTRPVREALRELAAEGFVRFDRRRGAVVRELCRTELEDIYEIRMMLEPVATARAAMSATGASLRPAIQLLAAMETETDGRRWAEHNASFHDVIALAGNSPRLVAMLTNLRELSTRYITHSVLAVPDRAARQRRARGNLARRRRTRSRGGGRCGAPSSRRHASRPADDPPARCASSRCLLGQRPGAGLITCQPGSSSLRVTE
jgi:DNA-binding GntR family transcriptional regulator